MENKPVSVFKIFFVAGLFAVAISIMGGVYIALTYFSETGTIQSVQSRPLQNLSINGNKFKVAIAASNKERYQGLSGVESLGDNEGMLFFFGTPNTYPFVMRGMKIPLDFVWINNGVVVDITLNAPIPETIGDEQRLYYSSEPVDMVLEINAGKAVSVGIEKGDRVILE